MKEKLGGNALSRSYTASNALFAGYGKRIANAVMGAYSTAVNGMRSGGAATLQIDRTVTPRDGGMFQRDNKPVVTIDVAAFSEEIRSENEI